MKWQLKARLQNIVAAMPFLSDELYFAIQRSVGGLRPHLINPLDRMQAAAGMVAWADTVGCDVRDKVVLEVGTGRMIDLPIGMWLCGASRVITVDLNRYLSPKLVSEARGFIRRNVDKVVAIFGRTHDPLFQHRLDLLIGTTIPDDALMPAMNVVYMSPADAANLSLDAQSIDLHVSHTVLEHIPPSVLPPILQEARRVLRPGGLLIHNIDPSDHFAHDDASITRINFLRFTEKEWTGWAGNRFMYHNRLRAADYMAIFAECGVRILKEQRLVDERSKSAIDDGFPVWEGFSGRSQVELATTALSIMGRFD